MRAGAPPTLFETLDECHRQIAVHLDHLAALARQVQAGQVDGDARRQAAAVDAFFSTTCLDHHEQEERGVFPPLLAIGDSVLVETVRQLQQEHRRIEAQWPGLATQLRAIAAGGATPDAGAFVAAAQEFMQVLRLHMELEDTVVYPESRTQWARAVAARMATQGPASR